MDQLQASTLVPIIDLNNPNQGQLIADVCLKHGFFYIDNRCGQEVNLTLQANLQEAAKKFFALSDAAKNNYAIENSRFQRGYVGPYSTINYIEGLKYDNVEKVPNNNESLAFAGSAFLNLNSDKDPLDDGNIYPSELLDDFKIMINKYFDHCWQMTRKVLKQLSPFLNMEKCAN